MPASKPPLVSRFASDGGMGLPKRTLQRLATPGLPLKRMNTSCVPPMDASASSTVAELPQPAVGGRLTVTDAGLSRLSRCTEMLPGVVLPLAYATQILSQSLRNSTPLNLIQSPSSV